MRIQTQNFFSIVPVFILLALGMSALIHYLEYKEIKLGLEEEASALAVTLAEMADKIDFAALSSGLLNKEKQDEMVTSFKKVAIQKKVERLFALGPDQTVCLFDIGNQSQPDTSNIRVKAKAPELGASIHFSKDKKLFNKVHTWAPVTDPENKLSGYIGVEMSAPGLDQIIHRAIKETSIRLFIALIAGIFCSWIISRVLLKGLITIDHAASLVPKGNYSAILALKLGYIREINDLGSAFNTIISILGDTAHKIKRTLSGSDLQGNYRDISNIATRNYWANQEINFNNLEFQLNVVGSLAPGSFSGLYTTGISAYCIFGKVKKDTGLSAVIDASSALSYLKYMLKSGDSLDALTEAVNLFEFQELTLIGNSINERILHVYHYDHETNTFNQKSEELTTTMPVFYHNLGKETENRFSLYIREFGECNEPAHILNDLVSLTHGMMPPPSGAIVVIFFNYNEMINK